MIDPAMHEILLPLWLRLISCSSSGRPGGTLPRKMAGQSTLETKLHQYGCLKVVHRAWSGHWSGGLATCSGEMVAAHWIEVVAVEASASGSSDVGLENSASVSKTERGALVLASKAGSSRVACKTG
jgi:hypothetical protein